MDIKKAVRVDGKYIIEVVDFYGRKRILHVDEDTLLMLYNMSGYHAADIYNRRAGK